MLKPSFKVILKALNRTSILYRPYRNQSNIGSKRNTDYLGFGYDSALLQQGLFSLFRDHPLQWFGSDCFHNQFTIGGTTRIYDKELDERFNLSSSKRCI